jgi:anti-sigma B factor antagonist
MPDNRSVKAGDIGLRVLGMSSQPTVEVAGRVTVNSSSHLRSVLHRLLYDGSGSVMTIDLSKVSYMDISGIATLMEALKIARERGAQLHLTGVSGQVRMLAEVTELDRIFHAVGSEIVFR